MQQLTSDNTPIRVDFLPSIVTRLPGRIGMTIAPGKQIRGIYGNWHRDLDKDLTRIKTVHGASVLVCLLEPDELTMLNIPRLPDAAREMGFEFVAFPIRDVSVPDSIDALRDLVVRMLEAAASGKTVVIHCRGGLGRSGLVAACCLAALGVDDDQAMAVVRATREGTIETTAQEQMVREYWSRAKVDPRWAFSGAGETPLMPPFSRILGCLIGGAVGDALGYPVEFIGSAATIMDRFGKAPPQRLDFARPGEALVSDDTQMSLFVAEGVIRAIQRFNDRGLVSIPGVIERALLRWYDTQTAGHQNHASLEAREWRDGWLRTDDRLYARRAPGNTCMASLLTLSEVAMPSLPINDSKGCGAVMRSAPIGLAAENRERAFRVACESGAQTHGHPLGYLPAGYLASVVWDVARGMPLLEAMKHADELLREEANQGRFPGAGSEVPGLDEAHRRGATELLACVQRARDAASACREPSVSDVEGLGAGWTGEEALAISLYCALTVEEADPKAVARALWGAVAHAGDSDSTGAIAGNILGACFGIEALPRAWVERVELRDTIERLAGDLYAVAVGGLELDYDAYPPS